MEMTSETSVQAAAPTDRSRVLSAEDRELMARLRDRLPALQDRWATASPFHYVIIDDFLPGRFAEEILQAYPEPDLSSWDHRTMSHQKKKYMLRSGFPKRVDDFFALSAAPEFRTFLSQLTGIDDLLDDPELVGGGLHQILTGGFLDVHIDYNFHPRTKLHRRLNLLVYMNKGWRREYGGNLELWDMSTKEQLESIAPLFNRAVIFETNEVSYHGHPKPLTSPQDRARRSLAVYYYTAERNDAAVEHNTMHTQTTGVQGRTKTIIASVEAAAEMAQREGVGGLAKAVVGKVRRRLAGLPPENR